MAESYSYWENFFMQAGVNPDEVEFYASAFLVNRMREIDLVSLDRSNLKEMHIIAFGDIKRILDHKANVLIAKMNLAQEADS